MKALAVLEIFLGFSFIALNWFLKIGTRVSDGAFALWRTLCERGITSRAGRRAVETAAGDNVCAEVPAQVGTAARMTRLMVQASFYIFGLWTVIDGVNYLSRGYWLSNPYVIFIAYLWVLMLALLPAMLKARVKSGGGVADTTGGNKNDGPLSQENKLPESRGNPG